MIRHRAHPGRRPRRGERGAVMVEFAVVALLLLTMLAGTFDFGMSWRSGLTVNESARSGARVGSSLGSDVNADFSLMSSLRATLDSGGDLADLQRVVIYRADTAGGNVPTACTTGNGSGKCNVFTGDQVRALPATASGAINTSTGCILNSTRCGWSPTSRIDVQIDAEYLGVWIKVQHAMTFRLLGTTQTIQRDAVMRLEPRELS